MKKIVFSLSDYFFAVESIDVCQMWLEGVQYLMTETLGASHILVVERWLRKEFYNIEGASNQR